MMQPVKNAWRVFGVYITFTGIGFILIQAFGKIHYDLSNNFFFIGLLLLFLGLALTAISLKERIKLKRLKTMGAKYSAKIESIKRNPIFKANRKTAARVLCCYENKDGKPIRVKSGSFVINKKFLEIYVDIDKAAYDATVYVNGNDPSDYAVDIVIKT